MASLPGKQIDHHSQIHPPFVRADAGEIARPGYVRLSYIELPSKQIGCCGALCPAVEAGFAPMAHLRT
ncbi:hypothetical protein FE36_04070 [Xanthomonas oryzae pv. oryzicola]|nr:hypothetical protein FE36_04070 [Xanthomonas oryzae pv. oryzicola]